MTIWQRLTAPFRRSMDRPSRRSRSERTINAPIAATLTSRYALAARGRGAVVNNPLAQAAVTAWVAQAVGAGIKPTSLHTDAAVRSALNARFAAWVDTADADGRTDWYGIQAALFRSMVVTGEGLAVLVNTAAGLRVRVLDPEQLDASYYALLDNGHRVVAGVEFDGAGLRVGYHLLDQPPGLELALQRNRRRVLADDVIHVFRQDWPGQVRGVSYFGPALERLQDLDEWRQAQLAQQKVSALLAGFVTSPDGTGEPFSGEKDGDTLVGGLAPGQLSYLSPGQDVRFTQPPTIAAGSNEFASTLEREVACALGLPAHVFGDVTRANYSSLKTAQTAWRARVEAIQWGCFIPLVCLPVWRRFVTLEVLSGRVESTVDAALPVKHVTPSWPTLEALKEINASVEALRAGLATRRGILDALGEDVEEIDAIQAADEARAKQLGLVFPALTAANSNTPAAAASS